MKKNKVIATIDISRPSGRQIVKELQKKKAVTLDYPIPDDEAILLDVAYEMGLDKLSAHYKTDMRQLKTKL